jgi:hypothetical protein
VQRHFLGHPVLDPVLGAVYLGDILVSATIRQIIESPLESENQGYGHRALLTFLEMGLCGACHQWGADPAMDDTGVCETCDRSEDEIRETHGVCWLIELLEPHIDCRYYCGEGCPREPY